MSPVEVRQFEGLAYVSWSRLPVPLVSPPVVQQGEVDDRVGEVNPLPARLAELIRTARAEGRPLGRRTVARELGISQYAAGQLLARTNNHNGIGGTP